MEVCLSCTNPSTWYVGLVQMSSIVCDSELMGYTFQTHFCGGVQLGYTGDHNCHPSFWQLQQRRKIYSSKHKYIFIFIMIVNSWDDTGSSNPSSWKIGILHPAHSMPLLLMCWWCKQPRELCNIGYPSDLILNPNLPKSRLSTASIQLSNQFEILHRARQWYCHALGKILKRSVDWSMRYG